MHNMESAILYSLNCLKQSITRTEFKYGSFSLLTVAKGHTSRLRVTTKTPPEQQVTLNNGCTLFLSFIIHNAIKQVSLLGPCTLMAKADINLPSVFYLCIHWTTIQLLPMKCITPFLLICVYLHSALSPFNLADNLHQIIQ